MDNNARSIISNAGGMSQRSVAPVVINSNEIIRKIMLRTKAPMIVMLSFITSKYFELFPIPHDRVRKTKDDYHQQ
jgi:hypothetical protein